MTRNPVKDNDKRSGRAEEAGRDNSLRQMQKPRAGRTELQVLRLEMQVGMHWATARSVMERTQFLLRRNREANFEN